MGDVVESQCAGVGVGALSDGNWVGKWEPKVSYHNPVLAPFSNINLLAKKMCNISSHRRTDLAHVKAYPHPQTSLFDTFIFPLKAIERQFSSFSSPIFTFSGIPSTIFFAFLILVTNFHQAITPSYGLNMPFFSSAILYETIHCFKMWQYSIAAPLLPAPIPLKVLPPPSPAWLSKLNLGRRLNNYSPSYRLKKVFSISRLWSKKLDQS